MEWKESLRKLERNKQWDEAIEFMQAVIDQNHDDMDAYIAMNYLLMNLIIEEEWNNSNHSYYVEQLQKYIDESYDKFSYNAEYLYYMSQIISVSDCFIDASDYNTKNMSVVALKLDPLNPIYKWDYHYGISEKNPKDKELLAYINNVLDENSFIQKTLNSKGAIGEYFLDMMTGWARRILEKNDSSITT